MTTHTTTRSLLLLLALLLIGVAPTAHAQTFGTPGDHTYVVPSDGLLNMSVRGADGGNEFSQSGTNLGGGGATVAATFDVLTGDTLTVVVGAHPGTSPNSAGGGGGSAVILSRGGTRTLLLVAGAGAGSFGPGNSGNGTPGGGGSFGGGGFGFDGGFCGGKAGTLNGGGDGGGPGFSESCRGASGGFGFGGGGASAIFGGGGGGGYGGGDEFEGGSSFIETSGTNGFVGTNIVRMNGDFDGDSQNGSVTLSVPPPPSPAVVTDAGDAGDANTGDGDCATAGGVCTLRAAIEEANATAGTDPLAVEFDITDGPAGSEIAPGVWRIQLSSPLPQITRSNVTVDGLTQPGASCGDLVSGPKHDLRVVLDGSLTASGDGISSNASGLTVRGLVVQNFTSGKGINAGGVGSLVECNYVGTDYTGETAAPNFDGVNGDGTIRNNLVSGNQLTGILASATSSGGLITRNLVGSDADGNQPLGNGGFGIALTPVSDWTVDTNLASANGTDGIVMSNNSTGIVLTNNTVGLTKNRGVGPGGMGNGRHGIYLFGGANDNDIGLLGEGNFVGGNGATGILIEEAGTDNNRVRGNTVGLTASGTPAPNGQSGLVLAASSGATVTGNTISGNTDNGVFLTGGTSGHVLENNFIGTNAAGDDLGNGLPGGAGLAGIFCNNASGVRIGQNFQPNTVRFNERDGIFLGANCQDVSVVGNVISDNGELAVDLAPNGVNPNDAGDGDTGANGKLNFPVVTSAENDGTNSIISWTLNARPNTTYELLFCRNTAPDPSGFGECQVPNALRTVTTNGSGNASGTRTLGVAAYPAGSFVSMNATKVDGALPAGYRATSEFGASVEVDDTSAPGEVTIEATPTSPLTVPRGGQVSFTYTVANGTTNPATGQSWFSAALGGNTVAEGVITNGTLPAGQQITVNYTQNVPNNAPVASYDFCLRIGLFPSPFIDQECFVVTVTPARVAGGGEAWSVEDVSAWSPVAIDSGTETEAMEAASSEAASSEALPTEVSLSGAYPNPFSGRATVSFAVPEAGRVVLAVYDVLGREVARLVDGELAPGQHTATFDGRGLTAGTYVYRLLAGGTVHTRQVTLIR